MKKTLITLLILIFATNLFSQETREIKQTANYYQSQEVLLTSETFVPEQKDTHLINITPNSGDTGWKYIGDQIAGNPGYWYQVLRSDDTVLAEDSTRYYYFYLNLFSASTYKDGTKAATYIKDIDYCIKDSLLWTKHYILLPPDQVVWAGWLRTEFKDSVSFNINKIIVH